MTEKTKIKYDIGIDDRVSNLENCDKKLLFTEFRNKKLTDEELKDKGIDGIIYELETGDTVEIPINTEFAFKGKMKMIEIMNPPFNPNTHIDTMKNDL